jgi:hypothetical protein
MSDDPSRPPLFDWQLTGRGWATATFRLDPDGDATVIPAISYLSDALRDLADALVALDGGTADVRVVLMHEPGQHDVLVRRVSERDVELEIRRYEHYVLGRTSATSRPFELRARGTVRWRTFRGCVVSVLQRLLREHGREGYRAAWGNADFPMEALTRLESEARASREPSRRST